MKIIRDLGFLLFSAILLSACGGGSGSATSTFADKKESNISISGTITYDRVPSNSNGIGLDYNNIRQEKVKNVVVELLNASNTVIDSTTTDSNGFYAFHTVSESITVKIRASAKMLRSGTPAWDVKVVDNKNSDALYVMEGSFSSSGSTNSTRDLNAPSGWGGSSYTSTRTAAPFAMLDDIYYSMRQILEVDPQAVFPPLQVNWSVNNVTEGTYYTNSNLFILGDEDGDTDEYDNHIISHEWGHYYEDKFSRSDSIGGSHSGDEVLDIRLALSEGWGNAFSAMALDDPVYFDTLGTDQANGFNFDVEHGTNTSKGWYSEGSVQRILYDLYDSNDDDSDILSLGFGPIHDVYTGAEKVTPAFTSIFTFITALKDENSADASEIDTIVASENIATITDIYGTGRINKASDYPYYSLNVGSSISVLLSNTDGVYNKLSNRKYVRFTIATAGTYTIRVQQTNGTNSDPDFYLFREAPFANVSFGESATAGLEVKSVSLTAGSYLLDIADYNNVSTAQLSVSIN